MQVNGHAQQGVDAGYAVGPGVFRCARHNRNVGDVGRKFDHDVLVRGRMAHNGRNLGNHFWVLTKGHAAFAHVGAGHVHFQSGHAFFFVEAGGQAAEFFGRRSVNIGYNGCFLLGQQGELLRAECFYAVILQPHGIEHAGNGFYYARGGIALTWLKGKALDHHAAKAGKIAVAGEFHTVAKRAGSRKYGIFEGQIVCLPFQRNGKVHTAFSSNHADPPGRTCMRRAGVARCFVPAGACSTLFLFAVFMAAQHSGKDLVPGVASGKFTAHRQRTGCSRAWMRPLVNRRMLRPHNGAMGQSSVALCPVRCFSADYSSI